jgi:protocatechuate 3,4-dioxygenase beta subunit
LAPRPVALPAEVLQTMLSREPPSIALTLLTLAAVAAASAGPARSDEPKGPPAGPPSTAAKADDANPTPAPGRMFVVGRVLDPQGKPVPGAAVMVHARDLSTGRAHGKAWQRGT